MTRVVIINEGGRLNHPCWCFLSHSYYIVNVVSLHRASSCKSRLEERVDVSSSGGTDDWTHLPPSNRTKSLIYQGLGFFFLFGIFFPHATEMMNTLHGHHLASNFISIVEKCNKHDTKSWKILVRMDALPLVCGSPCDFTIYGMVGEWVASPQELTQVLSSLPARDQLVVCAWCYTVSRKYTLTCKNTR